MANKQQDQTKQHQSNAPARGSEAPRRHSAAPTSVEGVEASDLPDGGRGSIETEPGHEKARHLPQNTGEVTGSEINEDVGLAGHPDSRKADQENFLGRHQGDK